MNGTQRGISSVLVFGSVVTLLYSVFLAGDHVRTLRARRREHDQISAMARIDEDLDEAEVGSEE
eukprot:CAMPEP_0184741560 /NCGR_PEP_ID=MMETSP0315-20130426/4589_1 /TAXON_ID=101924 /ORGANISM="Rhodosorus marinus, Strain UTEX LB 2760" /LENGTH=63 /DNA_ID=CAMNT_0027211929 /DNA_START=142 /DNA_END=333 /DNA_ORIENTATION=-